MMNIFILVGTFVLCRLLIFDVCLCSSLPHPFHRRGGSDQDTPPQQTTPTHQQQPADSFSSFQELLKLNPEELIKPFQSDGEDSASSHVARKQLRRDSNIHRTQIIKPKPSRVYYKTVVQPEEAKQSNPKPEHTAKHIKRADDYNLKRRLKRAEMKAKDPIAYKEGLAVEAERNRIRRKKRKERRLQNPLSAHYAPKDRSAIRQRIREGKGTKDDKEYMEQMRMKSFEYRKRKKMEKLQSDNKAPSQPNSKESR